jgi:hypothetical protein
MFRSRNNGGAQKRSKGRVGRVVVLSSELRPLIKVVVVGTEGGIDDLFYR